MKNDKKVIDAAKQQAKDIWKLIDYMRGSSPISDFRALAYVILMIRYMQSLTGEHFDAPRFYSFGEIRQYIDYLVKRFSELGHMPESLTMDITEHIYDVLLRNDNVEEEYVRWAVREYYGQNSQLLSKSILSELNSLFAEHEGKSGSEFYTPKDVNALVTSLGSDFRPKSICDPFAGGGDTAFYFNDVLDYSVLVDTQEINTDVYFQLLISRIIQGVEGQDFLGNSLTAPKYYENEYDLLVSFPPFGLKVPKSTRWKATEGRQNKWSNLAGELPETRSDWFISLSMLSALKKGGRAIIGMTLGAMNRGGSEKFVRECLAQEGVVETVILLPKGIHHSTSIPTVLVVLNPWRNSLDNNIRFVDASLFYEPRRGRNLLSDNNVEKILQSCREDGRFSYSASFEVLKDNNFSLDPARYVKKTIKVSQVSIKNFRGYRDFTIPMHSSLNVLVGENGAGKTSILEAVACGLGPFLTAMPDAKGKQIRKSDIHIGPEGLADSARISIETMSSLSWDLVAKGSGTTAPAKIGTIALSDYAKQIVEQDSEYPLIAYYGTSRALAPSNSKVSINPFEKELRGEGYDFALDARINYGVIKNWFSKIEVDELSLRDINKNHKFIHPAKSLIKKAVSVIVERATNVEFNRETNDVVIVWRNDNDELISLSLEQLSEGYRNMVALTIDLVRRAYLLNPNSKDPVAVDGVVLIDEVELHLHPRWQQRVIKDITSLFKNVQFIVTTHSPQVLTTVMGSNIKVVSNTSQFAESVDSPYGGESSRVMKQVLYVDPRPNTEVSSHLKQYFALIESGDGESDEALVLRNSICDLTDNTEPMLEEAKLAIKRVNWMKSRKNK
ncbi:N-6 DNA methylase [Vibrio parahaemolyticus]|uniref:N-6 DNA methylase n=1 Tax=Vibrio parahaemolyticus TaxID=670 RepID=UPI00111EA29B|nr:N-6 DNA methylase [Vibrio parahaemolyticus]TOI62187.1 type I restriction endonuclease subunit M [Vibrio parahaemolyticus]